MRRRHLERPEVRDRFATEELVARRVRIRPVVATALHVYRTHLRTILVISAILFAPLSAFDAFTSAHAIEWVDQGGSRLIIGGLVLTSTTFMMFGFALFGGLLDKLVAPEFGHEKIPLRVAARTLPLGRLVVLDLLVSAVVAITAAPFIVLGAVAFTLVALAGPIVVLERRRPLDAMRRSAQLTRRHFVTTFVVVTLPVFLEHEAWTLIDLVVDAPFLVLWAMNLALAMAVLATVVLAEVTLTFTLTHPPYADGPEVVGERIGLPAHLGG